MTKNTYPPAIGAVDKNIPSFWLMRFYFIWVLIQVETISAGEFVLYYYNETKMLFFCGIIQIVNFTIGCYLLGYQLNRISQ